MPMHRRRFISLAAASAAGLLAGCGRGRQPTNSAAAPKFDPVLADLQRRAFNYFWQTTHPITGLAPDSYPSAPFSSIAATGFALTAHAIGVQNGWVTRAAAAERVRTTLQFLLEAPQGASSRGIAGYQGFFYHFLDMQSGLRDGDSELSTVDTALLLGGALFCAEYFDAPALAEVAIRGLASKLYQRVNWRWAQPREHAICMDWRPETGFSQYDWVGYNEAMIVYLLALGSPTFPVAATAWNAWTSGYPQSWGTVQGITHLSFGPLFGHQYTQIWTDLRGVQDAFMRAHGSDYFRNSRLAVIAQHRYAVANPRRWRGYGANLWGLSACDGPGHAKIRYRGTTRQINGYAARGVWLQMQRDDDDGTITPTAALGSVPFVPELVIPAATAMVKDHGRVICGAYGFLDSFNLSVPPNTRIRQGRYVNGWGWVDTDYLGIDQGPIIAMIENYRSGLIWRTMRKNAALKRGMQLAGFTGGWLGRNPVAA